MLNRIEIKNFATIEDISVDLGEGLNIITGETGAGKSVLVQAISMALGERADISMVRTGYDKAVIQIAGTVDGDDMIISREIMSSGKSISKLNGEIISLSQLKEHCSGLVDIHGQYDNQRILDPDNHLSIMDGYRYGVLAKDLARLHDLYAEYISAKSDYDKLIKQESEYLREQDYYRFELENINALSPVPGEDESLSGDIELMKNSEKIYSAVANTHASLYENETSILSILNKCMNDISAIRSYSDDLSTLSDEISEAYYKLEDAARTAGDISSKLTFRESDLDEAQERLSAIESAKRKYGMSIDEILAYRNELSEKLDVIENFDHEKGKLESILSEKKSALIEQADIVSKIRHDNANILQKAITDELSDLAFANSAFQIRIDDKQAIDETGRDSVEFMISTNPGEPLRPLAKIASGGEISRIMLAFKRIIGDGDNMDTMIFDEIDTGISGKTALVVGRKLKDIASHHQVICITHLPQIAAFGDDNYLIDKEIVDDRSRTIISHLDGNGKVRVIAGLISGDPDNESSIKAANELISQSTDRA